MRAVLMILGACVLLTVAALLVIPVAVNLPESWFGGLLILLSAGGALLLIYKAIQSIRRPKDRPRPDQQGMQG